MTLRWGVCGTGGIATLFTETVQRMGGQVVAVASRTPERAEAFGRQHGIDVRYVDSVEGLAADENVDAVYIATPASEHVNDAALPLAASQAVLVEKPFAMREVMAQTAADTSKVFGVFCMEAMWSRFLPAYDVLRELLEVGRIGEVRAVEASFGIRADYRPELRPFRPDLGGGALSDAGPYPVQLAHLCLGEPDSVYAVGEVSESGVDTQAAMLLGYPGGQVASLTCALTTTFSCSARISGSEGTIRLPSVHQPVCLEVFDNDGNMEVINAPMRCERLAYEIAEVERCVADGLTESPVMPLDESVAIVRTLERARKQVMG